MYSDITKEHLLATLDLPSGGGVEDVQINGESITVDGVANIPLAANDNAGVARFQYYYGTNVGIGGVVVGSDAVPKEQYATKPSQFFVSKAILDGVLAAPSIMPALTDTEKSAARKRIGAERGVGDWELLNSITLTEETVHVIVKTADDGTPYDLLGLKARIRIPAGAKGGMCDFKCFINNSPSARQDAGCLFALPANNYAPPSTYVSTGVACFVPVGGHYLCYGGGNSQGGIIDLTMTSNGNSFAIDVFQNHITGFDVFLFSNPQVVFEVGTTIEVYGIRA